ncbi:hypothetical protein WICPIJ_009478 [Wickerhamomyces pijperi]|uniref:Phosphatidic acid phosphatase type 2/haloperoxidase domain-containing protein n=1 Tax=Wickerhamomyces pijperi TaxID=599730 RepID=A0A9P8TD49_WICPI|nr:hypothetical protein WICPIJ_009478 [Wickerhamomyces pijperi]
MLIQLFKNYFLSEKPPGATIADLNLELDPRVSIETLRTYNFTRNEIIHYSFLTLVFVFSFSIIPVSFFLVKLPIICLFCLILLIPFTSQFFLNALPVLAWVALFFSSPNISSIHKPAITVKVLPAVETILYGDNLSQILATSTNSVLDILAWLPYGIIHFSLPFIVAGIIFLWGPPTALRSFAFAFGYMNLFGVIIQLLFPAAPPWYKILHGLDPANYSMLGSPGGLARIDTLLHVDLYTTNFSKNSPVVFGAFPSLHSGSATMDALFLTYLFPKFAPLFVFYVTWLWWSTMYLTHHYFIDVIAGSLLSFVVFLYTKYKHLPVNESRAKNRWSYAEIRKLNLFKMDPLKLSLDSDVDQGYKPAISGTRTRSSSLHNPANGIEMNFMSRQAQSPVKDLQTENTAAPLTAGSSGSISPDASSVFESELPRSISRSSNTSATSVESQFDLGVAPSTSNKSRTD